MEEPQTPHSEHDPEKKPVIGCPECDKVVDRPVVRGFGAGHGSTVIPRKKEEEEPA